VCSKTCVTYRKCNTDQYEIIDLLHLKGAEHHSIDKLVWNFAYINFEISRTLPIKKRCCLVNNGTANNCKSIANHVPRIDSKHAETNWGHCPHPKLSLLIRKPTYEQAPAYRTSPWLELVDIDRALQNTEAIFVELS